MQLQALNSSIEYLVFCLSIMCKYRSIYVEMTHILTFYLYTKFDMFSDKCKSVVTHIVNNNNIHLYCIELTFFP